jgi:hypothetical protein
VTWTDEADELLRKLWEAGGSLATVAYDMSLAGYVVSRNAISGRKWRLAMVRPFDRPSRLRPKAILVKHRKPKMLDATKPVVTKQVKAKPVKHKEPQNGINYLEQTDESCKAILDRRGTDGLPMVCGKLRLGVEGEGRREPYCYEHFIKYTTPEARRRL